MANPVSMLLSSAFMLQHLGLHGHASQIRIAVEEVVKSGKVKMRFLVKSLLKIFRTKLLI